MDEQEAAELWILGKNKPDSLCFVGEELTNLRYLRSQEDRINLKLAQSRRINKMQTWRSVLLWWSPTFLSRLPFSFFLRGEENKETCVAGKLICKIIWLSKWSICLATKWPIQLGCIQLLEGKKMGDKPSVSGTPTKAQWSYWGHSHFSSPLQ